MILYIWVYHESTDIVKTGPSRGLFDKGRARASLGELAERSPSPPTSNGRADSTANLNLQ